jgi:hypothetical protein
MHFFKTKFNYNIYDIVKIRIKLVLKAAFCLFVLYVLFKYLLWLLGARLNKYSRVSFYGGVALSNIWL